MSIPVVAPFTALQVSAWAPSDWQTRLPEELAYAIERIGSGSVKAPVYADAAARDAVITAPAAGDVVYLTDAGTGTPALQIFDGLAWLDLAAGPPPVNATVEIPVYADAAARDLAVPAPGAGDLVYVTDAGSAAPAVQVHDGATWSAVWPAAASGGYDFSPPDWAWLDDPATEGTQVPLDLADWAQVTAGALTPVTLTPTLGPAGRYIILGCPNGYGAFVRSRAMADGADVCFLIQPLFRSATSLATALNAEAQAILIESVSAASRWVGAGPRYAAQPILSGSATLPARGNSNAGTGIGSANTIGLDATVPGLVASQPMAIRLRRSNNVVDTFLAEWQSGWKLIATSNAANFNPALPGLFAGVRASVPEAERLIVWAYGYFDGGVP